MYAFQGTVVGLKYQNGIALASDTRSTSQYLVISKRARKIFEVQDNIGAAITGSGGDIQNFIDSLKTQAKLYRLRREEAISTKSLAQYASNLLHAQRFFPYIVSVIFAGVDGSEPRLYFLDAMGGKLEEDKFASAGTGSEVAYGVLEQNYEENMKSEAGLRLAGQSIQQAIERDAATGDNIIVAKIDKEGFKELSEDEVKDLLK